MLHIPILRHGRPYESVEKTDLVHHATGEPVARVSQANSGLVARDIRRMDDAVLERFTVAELLAMCRQAAELFMTAALPLGDPAGPRQSFEGYIRQLSATTGMPITYCRNNAEKIRKVLAGMDGVLAGLTRGLDLAVLDRGYGTCGPAAPSRAESTCGTAAPGCADGEHVVSFHRVGRIFGAVLPSNSPGVHSLWLPAVALKAPLVLKPGREEPWTPLRIIEALAAAGVPREAFSFYPADHAGAAEVLRLSDRSMLFGDASTTRPWAADPRVEIHGPGYSKVLLGEDAAEEWERYVDVMVESIAANGGRSCINASAIWTPRNGRQIAEALAQRLARIEALPVDDPRAEVAAFANADVAERISALIDQQLREPGAEDVTQRIRGGARLVIRTHGSSRRVAYLLPTIIWIDPIRARSASEGVASSPADTAEGGCATRPSASCATHPSASCATHPLVNREFLFPYASVVECPTAEMPDAIGPTLVVSAITRDRTLIDALMRSPNVQRLNIGPIPTTQISWDQPHEGNLFELLYRQRAFQMEPAA